MSYEPRVQHEEQELAREVLEAAEQAHVLAGYSVEALSALITASRRFQRALRTGARPDPAPLLLAFGGATALLRHLQQRFDVGAQALDELHFGLELGDRPGEAPAGPTPERVEPAGLAGAPRAS